MRFFACLIAACIAVSIPAKAQDLEINGHMKRDDVLNVLNKTTGNVNDCFDAHIKKNLHGTVTVKFEVPKGKTKASSCKIQEDQKFADKAFKACMSKIFCNPELSFPVPTEDTEIIYPIIK